MLKVLQSASALWVAALLSIIPALADNWTLIPDESTLTFSGTQGGTQFDGRFERFTASIALTPANLEQSDIEITIDMASAVTGSADRDTTLPGSDWFDVSAHPTALFKSTDIVAAENGYVAHGTLTMKGTSHNVSLPFTLSINGDIAHAEGGLTIDRTSFAVGTGALSAMAGNDVNIQFDIKATR